MYSNWGYWSSPFCCCCCCLFAQALTAVLNSSQRAEPQNKTYLAGFIARAVAKVSKGRVSFCCSLQWRPWQRNDVVMQDLLTLKMVCPLFDQGAHHPTILVLLQALTALLGEVRLLTLVTPYQLAAFSSVQLYRICGIVLTARLQ